MLIQETQPDRASQSASCADTTVKTVVLRLAGHVQGVGFRPFVYQLAQHHELCGSVQNQLGEVEVIAQGDAGSLFEFENIHDRAKLRSVKCTNFRSTRLLHLPGLLARDAGSQRQALPLPLYQLHTMRPALYADPFTAL